jgi:hypothetical protein
LASCFAAGASPAAAELAHTTVTGEYGKEGPKASGLSGGCYVEYESAEHRIYFMANNKIWGLDRTGVGTVSPLGAPFPITVTRGECNDPHMTVDQSSGNIYQVPSQTSIYGFSSAGAPLGGFPASVGGETCGVATTNTGEVWGGNYSGGNVAKFTSAGVANGTIPIGYSLCKIAVDHSNNDLYVSNYGSQIRKYAAPSYTAGIIFPSSSGNPGASVNGARDRIYIPAGSQVKAYDTNTGELVETINFGGGSTTSVAVDEATDTLYIADTGKGAIKEIPAAVVPKATTGEPTGNSSVSGTADPDGGGDVVECFFEFGTTTSYGSTQPCDQATPYSSPTAVTATLPGLVGETLYHYRLVAGNANIGGRNFGADKTITPHNVKGLFTEPATEVTRTSAKLNASFEGNGEETKYKFQWGTTTAYGSESTLTSAGMPTFPPKTFLEFTPTNLLPDTTYHFRVWAENGLGVSPGGDRSFKTLPAVQNLQTNPATGVGAKVATLNASYEGDGDETTYYFEWGKTTSYGTKTPEAGPINPTGPTPLTASLSGLELETVYHYRIVATNSLGTTKGADQSFTTDPAVLGLKALPATEISQESITLNGEFNGIGEPTSYYFEWGLNTKYGKKTPGDDAGAPVGIEQLSSVITDFEAYSTYHFRIVAQNNQGITKSADMTFETLPAPLPSISETAASDVTATKSTMEAQINPNRWATVYLFEYGPSASYGDSTEISASIGSDNLFHPVDDEVPNLTPGTTYHFRAVAINFTGTAYGPDEVFTTPDAPRIDQTSSSGIGATSAHLSAEVSPNSEPTTVYFEYGPSAAYGAGTPSAQIGSGTASQLTGADLSGLTPATTYHFRAVATNQLGTTRGPDQTFVTHTAPPPPVEEVVRRPKKCKKGFVKRHGKCVKKKRKKKKKHHGRHRPSTRING